MPLQDTMPEMIPVEQLPEVIPVQELPEVLPASVVIFENDGTISIRTKTLDEAKQAIRELRSKKREYLLLKRAVMNEQRQIRASYTARVRKQGSKMRGAGGFGRVVRAFQQWDRDSARANLANALAPLERQRSMIEAMVMAIDSAILQVQQAIDSA